MKPYLHASVEGISTFFAELATFDQGIADADAAFISGGLTKNTTTLEEVQNKLNNDISEAMDYMTVVLTSVLAEKVAILGITIATNCNPLKLIFAGPDLADIASKANEVANAATDLVKGVALINALTELASDTHEFANAFIGNSEQL